jgi:AcrR family transcriptional regulator
MGTQQRRERERSERREEILQAARELFWSRGYNRTTMPEIAAAAELAPGTLYLYFPSKDVLYIELLVEGYGKLLAGLRAAADGAGAPRRQAEALIDAFLDFARTAPQYFDIIFFVLQHEGSGPHEALAADQLRRLEAAEEACKTVAAEVLRRAPGRKTDAEVRQTVEAVWSMLAGVIFFWRRDGEPAFSTVAHGARALLLAALFPK